MFGPQDEARQAADAWFREGRDLLGLPKPPVTLIPIAEAAERMGVTEKIATDLAQAGLLDSEIRSGGRLFVRPVILTTGLR